MYGRHTSKSKRHTSMHGRHTSKPQRHTFKPKRHTSKPQFIFLNSLYTCIYIYKKVKKIEIPLFPSMSKQ